MTPRYAPVLVVLAAAAGTFGCSRSPEAQPPSPRPEVQIAQGALESVERLGFEDASVERGMNVVVGTATCAARSGCFSCYQCHGIRGEGSATANFPRLSTQSYVYLKQSLADFASGRRPNPTMQEVVRGWSGQQLKDAAAYYSAVAPTLSLRLQPQDEAAAKLVEEGRQLAMSGSTEPVVQACADCHGANGQEPAAPIYPYLSGQHMGYIVNQLKAFSTGVRQDPTQIMNHVAAQLTEEQMQAVARYYASLEPPTST